MFLVEEIMSIDPQSARERIPSEPGFTLEEGGRGTAVLKIWGGFPPGWLASFTSSLSERGVNIDGCYARRVTPVLWAATFDLKSSVDVLEGIDMLQLASRPLRRGGEQQISLRQFSINESIHEENTLYVEVEGEDQVGFLMTLIKQFSFFSLFPSEMKAKTVGGKIFDCFHLKGLAGSRPSPEAVDALRENLWRFAAA